MGVLPLHLNVAHICMSQVHTCQSIDEELYINEQTKASEFANLLDMKLLCRMLISYCTVTYLQLSEQNSLHTAIVAVM